MRGITGIAGALIAMGAAAVYPGHTRDGNSADLDCKLRFSLSTWSAIYQHSTGTGTVTCKSGRSMPVNVAARGTDLMVDKSHVDSGTGRFSNVHSISDVLGSYAQVEAHPRVVNSGGALVLTKSSVSLALVGADAGEGIDLGNLGEFTLSRRN